MIQLFLLLLLILLLSTENRSARARRGAIHHTLRNRPRMISIVIGFRKLALLTWLCAFDCWAQAEPLPGTAPLMMEGDIASNLVTAMRVPALVTNYCRSICSSDFNDWVWKCASNLSPYSYVRLPENEIFEFDLGSTFNYAEMSA